MRRTLKEFLDHTGMTNTEFARRIGQSSQITGIWKRHPSKVCMVQWDLELNKIEKVTLEKVEIVYFDLDTESEQVQQVAN